LSGKRGEAPKPEVLEKIRSTKVSTEPEHVAQKVRLFSRLAIPETWIWKDSNLDGAEPFTGLPVEVCIPFEDTNVCEDKTLGVWLFFFVNQSDYV